MDFFCHMPEPNVSQTFFMKNIGDMYPLVNSSQIIATSHDLGPQNVAEVSGNPRLSHGIPGW